MGHHPLDCPVHREAKRSEEERQLSALREENERLTGLSSDSLSREIELLNLIHAMYRETDLHPEADELQAVKNLRKERDQLQVEVEELRKEVRKVEEERGRLVWKKAVECVGLRAENSRLSQTVETMREALEGASRIFETVILCSINRCAECRHFCDAQNKRITNALSHAPASEWVKREVAEAIATERSLLALRLPNALKDIDSLRTKLSVAEAERDEARSHANPLFQAPGSRIVRRVMNAADMTLPDATDVELSLVRIIADRDNLRAALSSHQKAIEVARQALADLVSFRQSAIAEDALSQISAILGGHGGMNLTQQVVWIPAEERMPDERLGKCWPVAFRVGGTSELTRIDGRWRRLGNYLEVYPDDCVSHWAEPLKHPSQL